MDKKIHPFRLTALATACDITCSGVAVLSIIIMFENPIDLSDALLRMPMFWIAVFAHIGMFLFSCLTELVLFGYVIDFSVSHKGGAAFLERRKLTEGELFHELPWNEIRKIQIYRGITTEISGIGIRKIHGWREILVTPQACRLTLGELLGQIPSDLVEIKGVFANPVVHYRLVVSFAITLISTRAFFFDFFSTYDNYRMGLACLLGACTGLMLYFGSFKRGVSLNIYTWF